MKHSEQSNDVLDLLIEFRSLEKKYGVKIESATIVKKEETFLVERYRKEWTEYAVTSSITGHMKLNSNGGLCENDGRCMSCGYCL
jgi:hypothetical protein